MTADMALLPRINGPDDVKALAQSQLPLLAKEIRAELIDKVCATGGHLGPNLGVVELSIALHRAFDSPRDSIIWDTGHQAYVHKMLTGRHDCLGSLRTAGGLSGYPSRRESNHDIVENSHASTSLAYADGLAKAYQLAGQRRRVVAVIGDGALTGGMAWEAMNNLGACDRDVIIVLNDNGRSYEPTVGALPKHLSQLRDGTATSNLFEVLGFSYLGPTDGHDLKGLQRALTRARRCKGPCVLHVVTRKGAGYRAAEADVDDRMHTVSARPVRPASGRPKWTHIFGSELVAIGEDRADVVAVTAAMRRPTGLLPFSERFPHRAYDVGIAEQHAVASAAGLAAAGLHPVVAIYSTFMNRAFDQVLMDVGLHSAPVTFVLDRSGVTGPDGPSHHGIWDISLFSLVPGMRVAAPRDAVRLRDLLREAIGYDAGPTAIRFPTGECPAPVGARARIGTVDVLTPRPTRADLLLVATGAMAAPAVAAANLMRAHGVSVTVVDPRWVFPISPELLNIVADHRVAVTVEDNALPGGFGETLSHSAQRAGITTRVVPLGLEPGYIAAGSREDILAAAGLDPRGIAETVQAVHWPSPSLVGSLRSLPG
ncbi:1-deoxy-D-xylulose-5-phosphate synthase [Leekyejoonella antrihumi]|uniref:1-deoxy-D-xylulose-5-phosphate synthase n=1 Tax=Leekyejoonella antrihumi TaxID=1660198 RepID=A0A563E609_9MICO|nr:1-deoxy-D-xylulose-5-phosphate synthase [Leekyejoonella antrihumi]TWP37683.1 1-deoxy-D-xylulose-5-phosphate synthase [Leekyejoonella antrihumi]